MTAPWPLEIRVLRDARALEIDFESGESFHLPAEYLRVESPSAEVQGHRPEQRVTVPGKRKVSIETAESVGNYAVRLRFTDGHDTGLYTWDNLHRLGREHDVLWAAYLKALEEKGLSRG
jgi:DUF971 family protein